MVAKIVLKAPKERKRRYRVDRRFEGKLDERKEPLLDPARKGTAIVQRHCGGGMKRKKKIHCLTDLARLPGLGELARR